MPHQLIPMLTQVPEEKESGEEIKGREEIFRSPVALNHILPDVKGVVTVIRQKIRVGQTAQHKEI